MVHGIKRLFEDDKYGHYLGFYLCSHLLRLLQLGYCYYFETHDGLDRIPRYPLISVYSCFYYSLTYSRVLLQLLQSFREPFFCIDMVFDIFSSSSSSILLIGDTQGCCNFLYRYTITSFFVMPTGPGASSFLSSLIIFHNLVT